MRRLVTNLAACAALACPGRLTASAAPVTVGFFTSDAWTRDPFVATNYDHYLIFKHVGQTLVDLGEIGDVVPGAASHWKVSLDRLVYEFTLREGLKFHDGTAVSAADVVATLNGALYANQGPTIVFLKDIEGYEAGRAGKAASGIQAVSDRVVRIRLKNPYAPLLRVLTSGSMIIRPKTHTVTPPKLLVASGPYRLTVEDGAPVLVPYAGYKGPYPPKTWPLKILADTDVFLGTKPPKAYPMYDHDVTADRVAAYREKGYQIVENLRLATSTFYIEPRSTRLPTYASRVSLLKIMREGARGLEPKRMGKPLSDLFPKGMLGHTPDRPSLLAMLKDVDAVQLKQSKATIRLGLPGSFLWDKDAFKANVKRATGQDVEFVQVDFLTYASEQRAKFDLDALFVNWANVFPDPETNVGALRTLDLLRGLKDERTQAAQEPALESLLTEAVTSAIDAERAKTYGLIVDRLFRNGLAMPMFQVSRLEAIDPTFKIKSMSYRQTPLLTNLERR